MATPMHHTSKTKKHSRRSHDALTAKNLVVCPNCGKEIQPHRVCPNCGYYDGKKVKEIKVKDAE